ncbi:hypothetical protein N9D38_07365 [Rubripirellula sp.]|nr:hypothetical protein [Rubripirellula sp.]
MSRRHPISWRPRRKYAWIPAASKIEPYSHQSIAWSEDNGTKSLLNATRNRERDGLPPWYPPSSRRYKSLSPGLTS